MGRGTKNSQNKQEYQPVRNPQSAGDTPQLQRVVGSGYIALRSVGNTGTVLLLSDQPQSPALSEMSAFGTISKVDNQPIYPVILQAADISWQKRIAFGKLWNYLIRHYSVASAQQLITYLKDQGITAQGVIGSNARERELTNSEIRELISEMTFRLRVPIINASENDPQFRKRGFKLARSAAEVNQYAVSLDGRIERMVSAFTGLKTTLDSDYWFGQEQKPQPAIPPYSSVQIEKVIDLLGNEVPNQTLCERLQSELHDDDIDKSIRTEQELRNLISSLRREGVPIEGSSRGYRLSQSRSELEQYLLRSQNRIKSVIERKKTVLDAGSLWFDSERTKEFVARPHYEFERSQAEIRRDRYKAESRDQQSNQAKQKKIAAAAERLSALTAAVGSTNSAERRDGQFLAPKGAGAYYRVKNGHGSPEEIRLVAEFEACRSFVSTGRILKGLKQAQRVGYAWLPALKRKKQ